MCFWIGDKMNIYLIGMPGSGKTTIGKSLAEAINYQYIDLDEYIEKRACLFISEIFQMYGEKYFRDLESNMLKELGELDNIVVSCGGGIVINKRNKDLMKGLVLYLTAPLVELERRTKGTEDVRPLLNEKTIYDLYDERKDKYAYFSDIEIDTTKMDIKAIVEVINNYEKDINN